MVKRLKDRKARSKRARLRNSVGVVCSQPIRAGLDIALLKLLQECERAFYVLRDAAATFRTSEHPDRAAVQQYLTYLSMLVDIALSAIVALALHDNARAAFMYQRLMLEYAAKADYYDKHGDYALWATTIGEREDYFRRMRDVGTDRDSLDAIKAEIEVATSQYPALAKRAQAERKSFSAITFTDMFVELADRERLTWFYKRPSIYIHGDPVGMREMLVASPSGSRGNIDFSDDEVNAHLVDTAGNFLTFCRAYQRNFTEAQTPVIDNLFDGLQSRLVRFARRYGECDPDLLEELVRHPADDLC